MTEDAHLVKWVMIAIVGVALAIALGVGLSNFAQSRTDTACINKGGSIKIDHTEHICVQK